MHLRVLMVSPSSLAIIAINVIGRVRWIDLFQKFFFPHLQPTVIISPHCVVLISGTQNRAWFSWQAAWPDEKQSNTSFNSLHTTFCRIELTQDRRLLNNSLSWIYFEISGSLFPVPSLGRSSSTCSSPKASVGTPVNSNSLLLISPIAMVTWRTKEIRTTCRWGR